MTVTTTETNTGNLRNNDILLHSIKDSSSWYNTFITQILQNILIKAGCYLCTKHLWRCHTSWYIFSGLKGIKITHFGFAHLVFLVMKLWEHNIWLKQMIKVGSLICLNNWPNWVQMFGELKWNVKRKYLISNFSLFRHVDTEYRCCYENHQLEQRNQDNLGIA